jgi:hypothetical protein
MWVKPNVLVGPVVDPSVADRGDGPQAISPALIGMSLRQDIPGGLPSGGARFRFSCHDHSERKDSRCQQKCSELRTVPTSRVSKVDTVQRECPDRGTLLTGSLLRRRSVFPAALNYVLMYDSVPMDLA